MNRRAFTLVEVLVALTILSVGLIPAFYQLTGALMLSGRIKNSLIAANLAQEGVEVVRAIRDANWFNAWAYNSGLLGECPVGCRVQYDSTALMSGTTGPLQLDATTGRYQYDSGTASPYTRTITIVADAAGGMRVDSAVTWTDRNTPQKFTVRTYLYDWLQ